MNKKPLLAAAEYRNRAAGARARAQMMPTENAKLLMTKIAEDYDRMALDREKFAALIEQSLAPAPEMSDPEPAAAPPPSPAAMAVSGMQAPGAETAMPAAG